MIASSQRRSLIIALVSCATIVLLSFAYLNVHDLSRLQGLYNNSKDETTIEPLPESGDEKEDKSKIGAIVVAARADTDLDWMDELQANWTQYPYNVDDPHPPAHLNIPVAKAHEAIVYLSFIIDNYDRLPPYTVFLHGHKTSWHQQSEIPTLLSNIRLERLDEEGYISMRCDWYPSCPHEIRPLDHDALVWGPGVHREDTELIISTEWHSIFGPDEEIPRTIASPCCAQFAVTREAIQRRGKKSYEMMREWILQTTLEDDVSGRVFEKVWAYIFTGQPVRCPAPQKCACEYFGQCEAKAWPEPPEGLEHW